MVKTLGDFTILRGLGSGATCKVKLAMNPSTGQKCAIKMLNENLTAN